MKYPCFTIVFACAALNFGLLSATVAADQERNLLATHCRDCHSGGSAEGGFDLDQLSDDLSVPGHAQRWTRLLDRVQAGEMPPPDVSELKPADRKLFVAARSRWLATYQQTDQALHGRVQGRRLDNRQLERSLHALLGIDIPLAVHFPEETRTNGYTTVADGQAMSHFQLEQHLRGVDLALDEAFRRAFSEKSDEFDKHLTAQGLSRENPKRRCREPELLDDHGVVWSSGLIFYGRIPATTAREDGWYRFTIRAKALKSPEKHGVWCTVRRGLGVSSAPLLAEVGSFEATAEPQEWTFETWLPAREMLEVRPGDKTLKKARFAGGQVGVGEGEPQNVPGLAIEWIKMSRIHRGPDNAAVRALLFDDLQVTPAQGKGVAGKVTAQDEEQDATRLLQRFAERAFRRPVPAAEVQPYVDFSLQLIRAGQPFADALRGGYRAILCSPRFLYFQEQPGSLDDYAIASRLSYFLWNAPPDAELLQLASEKRLHQPAVLKEQTRRLLADDRGRQFMKDFAEQWLDLAQIDFTEPDPRLYPQFDPVVQQAMLAETEHFLQRNLDENRPIAELFGADYTYLNSRLARFYGIPEVTGDALRPVSLGPDSPRGGLFGQGAILKVTANGSTTSPVIRGVWISERLLGQEIPPPPESVPAIEPDIRGATSIREQLAKHTSSDSCAACHRHIDPPGFALENFDPAGGWREKYGTGNSKNRVTVDPSHEFNDGRSFSSVQEFRSRVLEKPEKLAENLVKHYLTYGTGAPIRFADREVVGKIVAQAADDNFGLRTLIDETVTSSIFLTK